MPASVRLHGMPIGRLDSAPSSGMSFLYDREWLRRNDAYPISLSMPLRAQAFAHAECGPFFEGLLPDGKRTRAALGDHLGVDASNDYALLTELGRDCQGAISIVDMDSPVVPEGSRAAEWEVLDEDALARHISALSTRPLFVDAGGRLRISLAGVHGKAGIMLGGHGRVALPKDGTPSTHILKVDIDGLPDSIRVEHFCLHVAAEMGIPTARSVIGTANGMPYMVVTRYDRTTRRDGDDIFVRALHQEDFAQAHGRSPSQKYQKDGGPGWKNCFALVRRYSSSAGDVEGLLDRAIFQYLVGNPDAHAKNYSLVQRSAGSIGLSRFYDLNNAAAFRSQYKEQRARLAMSIGGNRNPDTLTRGDWEDFARETLFEPDHVIDRLIEAAGRIVESAETVRDRMRGTEADTHLLQLAMADIEGRARGVACIFGRVANGLA